MTPSKVCTRCRVELALSEFPAKADRHDGRCSWCRECHAFASRRYYHKNIDRHRAKARVYARAWRAAHAEQVRAEARQRRASNPEKGRESDRLRFARKTEVSRIRRQINGRVRLSSAVANRVRKGILHSGQIGAFRHLGYSRDELMAHLESLFTEGMSWDNYGPGWHVDHVIPVSAFRFESVHDIDFKRCWALSNLQPLWARDNLVKSDRLDFHFQPCLPLAVHPPRSTS